MSKFIVEFNPDYLKSRLSYEPQTGFLIWRRKEVNYWRDEAWNTRYAGSVAGSVGHDGYKVLSIEGKIAKQHRVCWAIYYGEWPLTILDHIDGDKTNNKIDNLRSCTYKQNSRNAKMYCNNSSGFRGLCWYPKRGKWKVSIHGDFLGMFDNWGDAVEARLKAERFHGYHKNHGRNR